MSVRLEEVVAALDALRAQVVALAGVVDGLRSDSAEHEATLARHEQTLAQLAEDVEDAEDSADMAGITLSAWGPTLGRLLPEFKRRHWPDVEGGSPPDARAAEVRHDGQPG